MEDWLSIEVEVRASQLSAGDWTRLLWGLGWRAVVFVALGGGLALAVGSLAGRPLHEPGLLRLAGVVGVATALLALPLYLRWLFHARFGSLRLALIRTTQKD